MPTRKPPAPSPDRVGAKPGRRTPWLQAPVEILGCIGAGLITLADRWAAGRPPWRRVEDRRPRDVGPPP